MNRRSAVGLTVGVLGIGLVILISGPSNLRQATETRPAGVALVFIATVAITAISAEKWRLILRAAAPASVFRRRDLFRVVGLGRLLGLLFHQDLGAALTATAYLSRGRSLPVSTAAHSILLERGLDIVAMLVLVPASALFAAGLIGAPVAVVLSAAAAGSVIALGYAAHASAARAMAVAYRALDVVWRWIRRRRSSVSSAHEADAPLSLDRGQLVRALLLSFARVAVVGLRVWFVVYAVSADVSLVTVLLLIPLAQLTLAVPLAPGGLGVYEAGWYGLLLAQGVPATDVLSIVVMQRVLSVLSLIGMGMLTEIALHAGRYGARFTHAQPTLE